MARKILISDADMLWLHRNHRTKTYTEMAERLGCCTDTLKRVLSREGLQQFEGAKYVPAVKRTTWTRPCMKCGDTQERERNLYLCDPCRAVASSAAFA